MKFSHFTELMRQISRPDKEDIFKRVQQSCRPKWVKRTAVACTLALVIGAVTLGGGYLLVSAPRGKDNHLPQELKGISTIAAITTDGDAESIATDSVFEITTTKSTSADAVRQALDITPSCDYSLKKTSGNTFKLKFDSGMQGDTLYTMKSMAGEKAVYSWAFQTESEFKITDHSIGTEQNSSLLWVEFSHSDVDSFEQYFSISPALAGVFEKYGSRWVFIPSSDFAEGTVYTVTVSGDITNGSGQPLGEDYLFNFVSRGDAWCELEYTDSVTKCDSFTTAQTPGGKISYGGIDPAAISISVHSIPTAAEFTAIHKMYVRDGSISSAIIHALSQPVLTFETQTLSFEGDSAVYFEYPQAMPAGYYISVITLGNSVTHHIFQVNDAAVYSVSAQGDTALWVNDTVAHQPLANITVTSDTGELAATDQNGIALFNTDSGRRYYEIATATPYVCITEVSEKSGATALAQSYSSYLRTDNTAYKAGDTVKLWGFTLPLGDAEPLDSAQLYCSWSKETVLADIDIDGMLKTELVTDSDMSCRQGYIDLRINGVAVYTVYLSFGGDSRETYNVTVTTDKPSYIAGETVDYTFYAQLADGTPAENVVITSGEMVLTTNSRGLATASEQVFTAGPMHREFSVSQPYGQTLIYADYEIFALGYFIKDVRDNGTSLTLDVGFADGFDEETDNFVTLELHRVSYQTEQVAERFNPVTMQKEPTLRSYAIDEVISTLQESFVDGTPIPYTIPADGKEYYMRIAWGESVYEYHISGGQQTVKDVTHSYTLAGRSEFDIGNNVRLTLNAADGQPASGGIVMLCTVSGGISDKKVFTPETINFEFTEKHARGAFIAGAYFDGTSLYPIEVKEISQREHGLDIEIETDKDSYAPGDTVTADISVTEGGIPQKAFVNINVTAPAQCEDIAGAVGYTLTDIGDIHTTSSTYSLYPSNTYREAQATKSGISYGGSVYFETLVTDAAGRAKVSFTLPTGVDEYTLSAVGVTDSAEAGSSTESIEATKALYITPFVASSMTTDDDASFALRFTGDESDGDCQYTATLFKDGIQLATINGTADYDQIKNDSLGRLDAGSYLLRIIGQNAVYSDTVECEFDVSVHDLRDVTVTNSSNTSGVAGDATVHLYDTEYELYYTVLEKMAGMTSARLDHMLARNAAVSHLGGGNITDISDCFTSGGLRLPDSDSFATPMQAAFMTAVASETTDISAILPYFDGIFVSYPDTASLIACNLVYASQGMAVLDDLNVLYRQLDTLTDEQLICLATAFAYAGDYTRALDIVESKIVTGVRSANGTATFSADTPLESEYLSCLAATVTSKVSHSLARELIKGLIGSTDSTVAGIAYYTFTNSCVPYLEGSNEVEYTKADGTVEKIVYRRTDSYTLTLSHDELKASDFEPTKGETTVTVSGSAGIGYQFSSAPAVTAECSSTQLNDGDSFTVTVRASTADSGLEAPYVRLTLPHGIKLTDSVISAGIGRIEQNGSDIDIYFSGSDMTAQLTCYAAIEGSYTLHAPALLDSKSEQYMIANDTVITVE